MSWQIISQEIFVHNYDFAFAEFFKCLPVIENLTISISVIKVIVLSHDRKLFHFEYKN